MSYLTVDLKTIGEAGKIWSIKILGEGRGPWAKCSRFSKSSYTFTIGLQLGRGQKKFGRGSNLAYANRSAGVKSSF